MQREVQSLVTAAFTAGLHRYPQQKGHGSANQQELTLFSTRVIPRV